MLSSLSAAASITKLPFFVVWNYLSWQLQNLAQVSQLPVLNFCTLTWNDVISCFWSTANHVGYWVIIGSQCLDIYSTDFEKVDSFGQGESSVLFPFMPVIWDYFVAWPLEKRGLKLDYRRRENERRCVLLSPPFSGPSCFCSFKHKVASLRYRILFGVFPIIMFDFYFIYFAVFIWW